MASRLEKLESRLAEHRERIAAIELELPALDVAEEDARREAITKSPEVRSDAAGANGPVGRIRRKRQDRERELAGLRAEVAAVESVIADERRQFVADRATATVKRLSDTRKAEESAYANLGAAFDAFVSVWLDEVVPAVEAHTELVTEVENDRELVNAIGDYDRMPFVYAIPRDVKMAFERLLIAADPMASHHQIGASSDYRNALPALVTERSGLSAYVIRRLGNFDWTQSNPETPNWVGKPSAASDAAADIAADLLAEATA